MNGPETKPPLDPYIVDAVFAEMAKPSEAPPRLPQAPPPHEPTLRGPFLVPGQTGLTLPPEPGVSMEDYIEERKEIRMRMNRPNPTNIEPPLTTSSVPDRLTPTTAQHVDATRPPQSRYQWLGMRSGVVGYSHRDANGAQIARHSFEESVTEKLSFLRHLAQGIGAELGLETLREVHIFSKDARTLSVTLDDGACIEVRSTTLLNTHDLAKQLTGDRKE